MLIFLRGLMCCVGLFIKINVIVNLIFMSIVLEIVFLIYGYLMELLL